MKVALISDIHSGYHALKACYEDAVARGAESFIFLGDYVSDLAEPRLTMDLVYEIREKYHTICLRGNREEYMLSCKNRNITFSRGSKSGSLLYTYERLQEADIEFFESLKIYDIIEIGGVELEIAHATSENSRYYFDSTDGRINNIFSDMKCKYLLTGHSHKQYIYVSGDKTIINPGSAGIPQGGSRWPKYAMLDITDGDLSCTLCEASYDIKEAIRAQFASGLVEYAKYWGIGILYDIITGEEWVLKLLRDVENEGRLYDEESWHSAAEKMGMKLTESEIIEFYESSVEKNERETYPCAKSATESK